MTIESYKKQEVGTSGKKFCGPVPEMLSPAGSFVCVPPSDDEEWLTLMMAMKKCPGKKYGITDIE